MKNQKKVLMGKRSRAAGSRFELKVRADLEKKGWVCAKWTNNVEFYNNLIDLVPLVRNYGNNESKEDFEKRYKENERKIKSKRFGKIVKVKNKFLGPGKPMMLGAGFPDFIALKHECYHDFSSLYQVFGVESKVNGLLDKQEKEKCSWLLSNNIFSKILIASKGEKRGEIIYKEWEEKQ